MSDNGYIFKVEQYPVKSYHLLNDESCWINVNAKPGNIQITNKDTKQVVEIFFDTPNARMSINSQQFLEQYKNKICFYETTPMANYPNEVSFDAEYDNSKTIQDNIVSAKVKNEVAQDFVQSLNNKTKNVQQCNNVEKKVFVEINTVQYTPEQEIVKIIKDIECRLEDKKAECRLEDKKAQNVANNYIWILSEQERIGRIMKNNKDLKKTEVKFIKELRKK